MEAEHGPEAYLPIIKRGGEIFYGIACHVFGDRRVVHEVVDDPELYQRGKHEHCARRHPNVDGFDVTNRWQRLLGLLVLSGCGNSK